MRYLKRQKIKIIPNSGNFILINYPGSEIIIYRAIQRAPRKAHHPSRRLLATGGGEEGVVARTPPFLLGVKSDGRD
jgi:hypothetical protein